MSKEKLVPQHVSVPHQWNVCKRHKDSICIYDTRSYKGCPFCVAQDIINPRLKDDSPHKGARPLDRGSIGPIGGKEE